MARFRDPESDRTVENRKPVRPETSTLSTTPTTIWLTRYFSPNRASRRATRTPARGAASRPTQGLPEAEAVMAARKAPPRS